MTAILGYTPVSEESKQLVNENKQIEERVLRRLDALKGSDRGHDPRWLKVATTYIELGFGAMNRAIMQPQRISLPEDRGVLVTQETFDELEKARLAREPAKSDDSSGSSPDT